MRLIRTMRKACDYMKNDRKQFFDSFITKVNFLFPDKLYLTLKFYFLTGKWINWKNPLTFNEKLQWLKLYNRRHEYTMMVDKFEVKKYVAEIIGERYIIPTLGVWDNFSEIQFDILPTQFVLKTTHSGGNTGVIICLDKLAFNMSTAKKKIEESISLNIYSIFREWPYKNVKPRIIAEQYMSESNGKPLLDYKFYCFNGDPKVMLVATGRNENLCFDYFDMQFNHLPLQQGGPNSNTSIDVPQSMNEMIEIARKLSKGIPHVRVDLYEINGRVYFGELTFFDSSGMANFEPNEWDYIFGSWIELPDKK